MKSKEMLIKIMKRSNKERGIRISNPNSDLSDGHTKKSDHNLVVMTDLQKLGHEDWVAITAYYAMYHSAMALLARIGLESKDHTATVSSLDYFFGKEISKEFLKKFHQVKEMKDRIENLTIAGKYISKLWKAKREREKAQYGISMSYSEAESMIKDARDFTSRMKIIMDDMDEKITEELIKKLKELKEEAQR